MKGLSLISRHPQRLFRGEHRSLIQVLILFLIVSISINYLKMGGLLAYIFPIICWTAVAFFTLYKGGGLSNFISWTNRRIAFMALLSAAFQLFIMIDAGLINRFGKSPLSFDTIFIIINAALVSSNLLGRELSRGYLVRILSKKKIEFTLVLITILYTFTSVSISSVLNFKDPLLYTKFMGKTFMPTLASNLLSTYVAQVGGPLASLAYIAPLKLFQWFSPVLPDLSWGYESIIGVMTPTIGFVTITTATTNMDLRKAGMISRNKRNNLFKKKGGSMKGWMLISIFFVLVTWTSTGLLGFYPTIIASGSMRPTMDVGDIAIVVKADQKNVKEGDVIQYWDEDVMVLHRIIDIYNGKEGKLYTTKGDANDVADIDPVFSSQIKGKMIFSIPKIGWFSIYTKQIVFTIWSYLKTNLLIMYSILTTIMVSILSYFIIYYKKRSKPYRFKRGWLKR